MTKSELIAAILPRFPKLSSEDVEAAVKTILDSMTQSLTQRTRVEIRGFGSFFISHRPPRIGRNPRTGEKVDIPATSAPLFKVGKLLREKVERRLTSPEREAG